MNDSIKKITVACVSMLLIGTLYAWSVLSVPIKEELSSLGQGSISLVFTLAMSLFCIGGLVGGYLKTKGKGKYIVFASALIMAAGYVLTSMATSALLLNVGFGVLVGFGTGVVYNFLLSNVSNIIPGKQGLVSGLLLFGFGMGSMIFGQVYTKAITSGAITWRSIFFYFGIFICAFLMIVWRVIEDVTPAPKLDSSGEFSMSTGQMLKTATFWTYLMWALVISGVGIAIISQGANIMKTMIVGATPSSIALVVGMISIANGFGRILTGMVFDKKGYLTSMTMLISMMLSSQVLLYFNLKLYSLPILLVAFILTGLAYGGCANNNSAFINRYFGQKYYAMNLSVTNMNILIASYASTLSGRLYDTYGGYTQTFILAIGSTLVGVLLLFVIRSFKTRELGK